MRRTLVDGFCGFCTHAGKVYETREKGPKICAECVQDAAVRFTVAGGITKAGSALVNWMQARKGEKRGG